MKTDITLDELNLILDKHSITKKTLIMSPEKLLTKLSLKELFDSSSDIDSHDIDSFIEDGIIAQTKSIIKAEADVDNIVTLYSSIDLSKVTLLTGSNGSGKSLIRKMVSLRCKKELNMPAKAVSMNTRTGSNAEWGALSSAMNDSEWSATSHHTFSLIQGLINACESSPAYIILDEFEIGCSEETVMALIHFINTKIIPLGIGCLIITHSRLAVQKIAYDDFVNIQGLSVSDWINREIIPTDLSSFDDSSFFCAIRDRMNSSKAEKQERRDNQC